MNKKRKFNRTKYFIFYFTLLSVFFNQAKAQNSPDFYEAEGRVGYIVKNYPVFLDLPGPVYMAGFKVGKRLNGSQVWHRYYHYPYLGLDLTMGALPNRKALGNVFAISPEMSFSQRLGTRLYLGETLGMGVAGYNRPYNKESNPSNTLIGSRLTAFPHFNLGLEYYVTPWWSIWLRAGVYHGSNCHFQLPNLGINVPTASLAVRYHPHPAMMVSREKTEFLTDKKIHFNIRLGLGVNERGKATGPTGGPKYLIYVTQFYLTHNAAPVNKIQAGFEFNYNTGVHDSIYYGKFYTKEQNLRSTTAVFFLGHEFLMGHFSLALQGGIFLYNPYFRELQRRTEVLNFKEKLKTVFIARLGFQYYFKDIVLVHHNQLYAGLYVKTNFGQADYLDVGMGYTF